MLVSEENQSRHPLEERGYERVDGKVCLEKIHVFWLAGMSCDACTVSVTGAENPTLESLLLGAHPGVPRLILHSPLTNMESGAHYMRAHEMALKGELDAPYVIVLEGSATDETKALELSGGDSSGILMLVAAVDRGRPPRTVEVGRGGHSFATGDEIHAAISAAITGYVDLDLVLLVAEGFGVLQAETIVVEVEPATTGSSPELSASARDALDRVVIRVRSDVAPPPPSGAVADPTGECPEEAVTAPAPR